MRGRVSGPEGGCAIAGIKPTTLTSRINALGLWRLKGRLAGPGKRRLARKGLKRRSAKATQAAGPQMRQFEIEARFAGIGLQHKAGRQGLDAGGVEAAAWGLLGGHRGAGGPGLLVLSG